MSLYKRPLYLTVAFFYLQNMHEEFLHYLWKHRRFSSKDLKTTQGEELRILSVGDHNTNAGPDFFNSRIMLDDQEWVGNVELHMKSSDWYVHGHEIDEAYDNVILHVVWIDNMMVFDANHNKVSTLELKRYINSELLEKYQSLRELKQWINCENQIDTIDVFTWEHWKGRLLVNRLHRKTKEFNTLFKKIDKNWEELLFLLLAKSFGLKINAESFFSIAKSISFKVFKKERFDVYALEALLFGQGNLLHDVTGSDEYMKALKKEYDYLKHKHQLVGNLLGLNFFRLRPANFPTIRLAQFASLYNIKESLFSKVIEVKRKEELYQIFEVNASAYWNDHYVFNKVSSKRIKKLSKSFIDLLIINTIIPIKYMYAKSLGKEIFEDLLVLYRSIKPEQNMVVNKFEAVKIKVSSAADSQSLIELYKNYCVGYKCLQCEIGNKLLNER